MAHGRSFDDEQSSGGLSDAAPHYHGHRERLRARFREAGSDAVTDYELLELLLFRALPRRDVEPLAKALIAKFGSFAETIAAPPQRLAEVPGLGEAAITEFKIVQAAANRLAHGEVKRRPVLSSWSAVLDYCRTAMAFAEKEQFRVLFLAIRNSLGRSTAYLVLRWRVLRSVLQGYVLALFSCAMYARVAAARPT